MEPTMARPLAVIHTVTALVPVFDELIGRHLPNWKPFNIVDESLLRITIGEGSLSQRTIRRFAGYVWSAADAGAEAILVTCSSLGRAVDEVAHLSPVPLVRVDLGMVDRALETGGRIGVLATLRTTLEPTTALVRRRAGEMKRDPDIQSLVVDGAFEQLSKGNREEHDRRIVESVNILSVPVSRCDHPGPGVDGTRPRGWCGAADRNPRILEP
ncbi:aspartate/glutamate racemase family protein [Nostoc sp. NIES-2111]